MPITSAPASLTSVTRANDAVYVVSVRGTVIVCVIAPPSLQPENAYGSPPMTCGVGAVMSVVAFWMKRSVNGAVAGVGAHRQLGARPGCSRA